MMKWSEATTRQQRSCSRYRCPTNSYPYNQTTGTEYNEIGPKHPDGPSVGCNLYTTYIENHTISPSLLPIPSLSKERKTHIISLTSIESPLEINHQLCTELTILRITLYLEPRKLCTFVRRAPALCKGELARGCTIWFRNGVDEDTVRRSWGGWGEGEERALREVEEGGGGGAEECAV